ncbi:MULTISPECIES: M1 family metallopeptidase [Streptomyces]|uniref:Aminopeptidase N n=1 Tax=Streptomyces griseus subsp. griseus (strain JCM 4626 / CBS 651.72 / NBRC 13350 / KCC S-0626 / ISP 5235) TaxID=455632 RepID=B1VSC2_STRGG|nr:M1 family metallopeptidase [Streptomyces griseus]BAG20876.1 putative metallopeptidase [Streptomyces griseus subsp. griseus NBRC 13350]SEE73785.1 Peptidase family M1 [Streptomyces griseus]SQA21808.1 metallopeptidase [Streptomyces griseus]
MNRPRPVRRRTARTPLLPALALALLAGGCTGGVEGTPGAAGLRDPYFPGLGNGGYDVTHYGLELDVDPAGDRLRGTATITARATQDLSAFHLDLAGLDVESAAVEGRPAAVNRAGKELTLRPAADVEDRLREGRTFTAVVRYSGSPETITDPDGSEEGWLRTADGAVALGEPAGSMAWFPGNHHPSDKAAYDIEVTVPDPLKAVSNGQLVARRTEDGRTAYHWRTTEPMASYLATVAVGRFTTEQARTAEGIRLFTAVDPASAAASEDVLERIPEVLAWSRARFGPYPFTSAGAIVERTGDATYALETQNRPVFPGPPDTGLLVHELAHQWFGNSVTPKTWQDMWLNEGFATYAEWLWAADHDGVPVGESFDEAYEDDANWAFPPADPPTAAELSEPPVYGRGAMVVHRIRLATGDDRAFFALVRGWTEKYRHANASTDDFTAYVEAETGQELGGLWDDWLYGGSRPAREG